MKKLLFILISFFSFSVLGQTSFAKLSSYGKFLVKSTPYLNPTISDTVKYYRSTVDGILFTPVVTLSKRLSPSTPVMIKGDSVFCQTSTIQFITKFDTNSTSYSWSFPNGADVITGLANDSITVGSLSTGNIIVKGINSCGVYSDSLVYKIRVDSLIGSGSITSISADTITVGGSVTLTADIKNATSYNWTLPANLSGVKTSNPITITANGYILNPVVKVTGSNICGTSSEYSKSFYIIQPTTNINEFENVLINVYPNPTSQVLNISVDSRLIGTEYSIYNQVGERVLLNKIESDNTSISIDNLPNGIYLLMLGNKITKIVKI